MRNMAYKFRIYPTKEQTLFIRQACGCRRFVYNWGLEQKQKAYQEGKKVNVLDIQAKLPELKVQFPWLGEVNSQSHQVTLRDLDMAFTRFFKGLAEYPTFKKKGKSKNSFQVPQHFKIDQESQVLTLPKMGSVRIVMHREIIGTPCSITVSTNKAGDKFFASILTEQDIEDPEPKPVDPETTIGLDMGIKSFAVVSNGEVFENPKFLRKSESKLKLLGRQHSRKQKDGKNRERARRRLARQHEKVANQRRDFLNKASSRIADESQVGTICIEDLNVEGMLKNHCLAKSIQDCGWGEFFGMLKYKCRWRGIRLVKIGRFEPSSRLCPCGFKNDKLTLADREWTCPRCGRFHDRDLLAANNVRRFGLVSLMSPSHEKEETAVGTTVAKPGELSRSKGKPRTRKPTRL